MCVCVCVCVCVSRSEPSKPAVQEVTEEEAGPNAAIINVFAQLVAQATIDANQGDNKAGFKARAYKKVRGEANSGHVKALRGVALTFTDAVICVGQGEGSR